MHSYVDYCLSVEGGKLHGSKRCPAFFSVNFMTVCERIKMMGKVSHKGVVTLFYFQVAK